MFSSKVKKLTLMAMLMAVLVVCSQVAIPLGSTVLTAQTLAVMLIALLLPPKSAAGVVLAWVLAGGIGLPFFANFKSGFGVLLGPTGGYIYGFVLAVLIISAVAGPKFVMWRAVLGCTLGLVFVYLFGAVQLMWLMKLQSYAAAFVLGAVPYIFFEPVKIAAAVAAARLISRRKKH